MTIAPQLSNALKSIVDGSAVEGFMFANSKSPLIRALEKEGMIEGNSDKVDPANADKFAYRATVKGLTELGIDTNGNGADHATDTGLTPVPEGMTVTEIPAKKRGRKAGEKRGPMVPPAVSHGAVRMALPTAPVSQRGGNRGEVYPFAKLAAPNDEGYDSFFVANTEAMPNAFKTAKAAVASANKRYLKANKPLEFTVRDMPTDPEFHLAGCRVYRIK